MRRLSTILLSLTTRRNKQTSTIPVNKFLFRVTRQWNYFNWICCYFVKRLPASLREKRISSPYRALKLKEPLADKKFD